MMNNPEKVLSFNEWMAENNRAYYARRTPGKAGDFITSPIVHRAFGEALARQVIEMDSRLGHPDPFFLVEFGGGTGRLAFDLLQFIREETPAFFSRLHYGISDFPEAVEVFRQKFLEQFSEAAERVRFFPPFHHGSIQRLPAFPGCILANEFLDALPVHLVVKRGSAFQEIFVAVYPDRMEIREMAPSGEVLRFIEAHHLDLQDGCFAEVNLEMQTWIRTLSSSLTRGFVLVLDYGGAGEVLRGDRNPQGTLRGFKSHRLAEVFTLQLGEGDWTSDVDFSTLARLAEREGFSVTGYSTQGNFLLGLGIADQLPTFRRRNLDLDEIKEHLAMKFLFHPAGLGNACNVLGLHKGMPEARLSGFSMRQEKL